MRKILSIIFGAALLSSPAMADWTGKNAAGSTITFKNAGDCTSVVCVPVAEPVDSTGAAFGVVGNPFFITAGANSFVAGSLAIGAGVDGWNITEGSTTDAAATAGSTGSMSAKLRLMTTQLAAVSTNQTVNGLTTAHTCSTGGFSELGCLGQIDDDIKGPIAAGTNTIGNVGSDPSSGKATPTEAFLALPATTTTQIIALSGTKVTYVTLAKVLAGGTVNVTFKYGTGSNCGTGTTTLEGPWPLTTQAGWVEGNGAGPVMIVPSAQALCITTDASVGGGVKLIYQQF